MARDQEGGGLTSQDYSIQWPAKEERRREATYSSSSHSRKFITRLDWCVTGASWCLHRNQQWSLCLRSPQQVELARHLQLLPWVWPLLFFQNCVQSWFCLVLMFLTLQIVGSLHWVPAHPPWLLTCSWPCSSSGFFLYHIPKGLFLLPWVWGQNLLTFLACLELPHASRLDSRQLHSCSLSSPCHRHPL